MTSSGLAARDKAFVVPAAAGIIRITPAPITCWRASGKASDSAAGKLVPGPRPVIDVTAKYLRSRKILCIERHNGTDRQSHLVGDLDRRVTEITRLHERLRFGRRVLGQILLRATHTGRVSARVEGRSNR